MASNSKAKDRQDKRGIWEKAWDNSLGNWFNGSVFSGFTNGVTAAGTGVASVGITNPTAKSIYLKTKNAELNGKGKHKDTGGGGGAGSQDSVVPPHVYTEPDGTYKWNLPPHKWSLPVTPSSINSTVARNAYEDTIHSTRRGRIFYSVGLTGPSVKSDPADKTKWSKDSKQVGDSHYGFQFMWNPETFSQNTAVNMSLTQDGTDPTAMLTSFVAANATIDFTLRIDRTNDFACFKAYQEQVFADTNDFKDYLRESQHGKGQSVYPALEMPGIPENLFAEYYRIGQPAFSKKDFSENMQEKLTLLAETGTMSDIEYLYRAINGDGFKLFGKQTSNIGYLMPTIVRLDLGPQKFSGIVKSININHLAFTQDMIPIRSDVSISLDTRTPLGQIVSVQDTSSTTGSGG